MLLQISSARGLLELPEKIFRPGFVVMVGCGLRGADFRKLHRGHRGPQRFGRPRLLVV